MNIFGISGLIIAIADFLMVVKLLLQRNKRVFHIVFAAFLVTAGCWGLGGFLISLENDYAQALLWWKLTYIFVIFIPIFFCHFVYSFLEINKKYFIFCLYLLGIIFIYLNLFTKSFFTGVRFVFNRFYYLSEPKIFYNLFVLFFILIFFHGCLLLWKYYHLEKGVKKAQIKYLLLGVVIGVLGGSTSYLPVYGIDFYPILNSSIILMNFFFLYTIIRYRLIDLRLALRNLFVFIGLACFTVGMFYLVICLMSKLFGTVYTFDSYILSGFVGMFFVLSFYILLEKLNRFADKYLFSSFSDLKEVFSNLIESLHYSNDVDILSRIICQTIQQAFKIKNVALLLVDNYSYRKEEATKRIYGCDEGWNCRPLLEDPFFLSFFKKAKGVLVKDELSILVQDEKDLNEKKRLGSVYNKMEKTKVFLCVPLISNEKLVGVIVLGDRKSDEAYTIEEVDLLLLLSYQASIALNNALLYRRISDFNRALKERVKEQTKEIKAKADHLGKLLEMKSEFLDVASHQLKTPISVIRGTISMFTDGTVDKLPIEDQKRLIANIADKADKLHQIVSEILKASEVDTDKFTVNQDVSKAVNLEDVISTVEKQLSPIAKDKGLEFKVIFPEQKTDPAFSLGNLLEYALFNLIDNAVKYTQYGMVEVALAQKGKDLIVKVKDSGIGIPEEEQSKIFGKFARAKNAINLHPDGTGLGLFIVKKIIEGHKGGKVHFESEEGKGSTFTVILSTIKA